MITIKNFIHLYLFLLIVFLQFVTSKVNENCKIIKDKETSKYILSGKCENGIYYVNIDNGKKVTEFDYDLCKKGSIIKYTIISGKMKSEICNTIIEGLNNRDNKELNIRSGSDDQTKEYKLFNDKSALNPNDDSSPAYLFYCEGDECINKTFIGYYINDKDNIYSCKANSEFGSEVRCSKDIIGKSCTEKTVGKVFYEEDEDSKVKYSICLDYNGIDAVSTELSDKAGVYLVGYSDNNVYGLISGQYAMVEVNETSVTLYNNYANYIYVDKTSKNKILRKGEKCPNKDYMSELICDKGICQIKT